MSDDEPGPVDDAVVDAAEAPHDSWLGRHLKRLIGVLSVVTLIAVWVLLHAHGAAQIAAGVVVAVLIVVAFVIGRLYRRGW